MRASVSGVANTQREGEAMAARFSELFTPLLPSAYRTARCFTRDPFEADDLVQEAALNAYRGFGGFVAGTNFRAWFMRILANSFFARYRRERSRVPTSPIDDVSDHSLYEQSLELGRRSGEGDPVRALLSRLDLKRIIAAIEALPLEFREVAALYFVDDYSYMEMAEILECPVGTIRSRLHRARGVLKRSLWDLAMEHGNGQEAARGALTNGPQT